MKSFKNALKETDVNSSNIDHTTDDIGKLNNLTEGINKEEQKKLIEALKNPRQSGSQEGPKDPTTFEKQSHSL